MSELDAIIPNIYQGYIHELRIRDELTQEELAQLTGISTRTIGNIESLDKRTVSRKVVDRLAKFYGAKNVTEFTNRARQYNLGCVVDTPDLKPFLIGFAAAVALGLVVGYFA